MAKYEGSVSIGFLVDGMTDDIIKIRQWVPGEVDENGVIWQVSGPYIVEVVPSSWKRFIEEHGGGTVTLTAKWKDYMFPWIGGEEE